MSIEIIREDLVGLLVLLVALENARLADVDEMDEGISVECEELRNEIALRCAGDAVPVTEAEMWAAAKMFADADRAREIIGDTIDYVAERIHNHEHF